MKDKKLPYLLFIISLFFILLSACNKENKVAFQEPVKEVSGAWKIVALVRNGEDLTSRLKFSDFSVVLNEDGTYQLDGKWAFIVRQNGTYTLNDPQYPFNITFSPVGDSTIKRSARLNLPVRKGKRQMQLTFSLGCEKNTYTYTMERE